MKTQRQHTLPKHLEGGGKFEYLTPEIIAIDIAVEKGFATSGQLQDLTYDNSWEEINK